MLNIGLFPFLPRWLRNDVGVRTTQNDLRYAITKPGIYVVGAGLSTGILDRVVEQGGDCGIFISAVFQSQGSDAQQIRNVGNGRSLTHVAGVDDAGIGEGLLELRR